MELEDLLKAGPFLDEVSLSVKKIIFANFPCLTEEEREEIGQDVKLKLLKMASRGKKIGNLAGPTYENGLLSGPRRHQRADPRRLPR